MVTPVKESKKNTHQLEKYGIEGVYIIHSTKGYELQEQRIIRLFGGMDLPFEFVTDGDVSRFTPELLEQYFDPVIYTRLSKGILSCTLNHIFCYEKMVERQNRFALIFENDPFFLSDFMKDIVQVCKEAATLEPGFMISLENSTLRFPSARKVKKGQWLYEAGQGRCAGAYLIDLHAAEAILEDLRSIRCDQVIDWWHNGMLDRNVMSMYWAHPPLTEQGSHNGKLASPISGVGKSLKRRLGWWLQKTYKTHLLWHFT